MFRCRGQKTLGREEVWVLQQEFPDFSGSPLQMCPEWIRGSGRRNGGEDIQRICIQNSGSGDVMITEKVGAKDRDGDRS